MRVQFTCVTCGATFYRKPSDRAKNCSRACQFAAQIQGTERLCLTCGTPFTTRPSEIRKGGGKFCSHPCYAASVTVPLEVRYWAKVNKNGPIQPHCPELGPCWEWTGARTPYGYGVIGDHRTPSGKQGATRIALEFDGRPAPDDTDIRHACDWPPCVRPDHLTAGTTAENLQDMVEKGRDYFSSHPGARVGDAKLTEAVVLEALAQYHSGRMSIKELARVNGMSISGMRAAITGKNWVHLRLQSGQG